ncbi:MAG: RNA 2',3'-cyclic phosphodiesterase [candidate division WOR-3 bacterium]
MRVFIALNIPEDAKRVIYDAAKEIYKKYPFIKPVPKENLHITLRFIGDIGDRECANLLDSIGDLGKSFTLTFNSIGGFPTEFGARVIWVGVEEEKMLIELSKRVDGIVDSLGLPPRDKPFVPHITIARTGKPVNVEGFKIKRETFIAGEVVVYQSILAKPNAIYKPLKVLKLGYS